MTNETNSDFVDKEYMQEPNYLKNIHKGTKGTQQAYRVKKEREMVEMGWQYLVVISKDLMSMMNGGRFLLS